LKSQYHQYGGRIRLKHGDTYYQYVDSGAGKETVVLIHGITWWSFSLDPAVSVLVNQGYSVLTFDLYGRGQSDSPDVKNDLNLFVEQTRELIDTLIPRQKVIISGLSMGGAIAVGFIATYPQYVSRAILMCPAGITVPLPDIVNILSIPLIGWLGFKAVGKSSMITITRNDRLCTNFHQFEKLEQSGLIQQLVDSVIWQLENKIGFLDAFHSTLCNFPFNNMAPYLKTIDRSIPILLLWGDHDRLCQGHDEFIKLVPQTQLGIMKDCGHAFLYEDIEQAEGYIISFLNTQM